MTARLEPAALRAALLAHGVDAPEATLAAVAARYGEPHRAYHGASHIEAMLGLGAAVAFRDPAAFLLATLYHDAIYDPARTDNEPLSAELLRRDLDGVVAASILARADAMIRATQRHEPPETDDAELAADAAAFLDIDLAVLGAAPSAFDAYDAAIRQEYAHVPEPIYRLGRMAVLGRFLARERLFLTPRFAERFEAPARANLERAIVALRDGIGG